MIREVLNVLRTQSRALPLPRSNPSNAWACLRTIDAFGVDGVHVCKDTLAAAASRAAARGQKVSEPQRHRYRKMTSAMGAQKWLSLREHETSRDMVDHLHGLGYAVAATDLGPGALDVSNVDWTERRYAIVFGNEEVGISDDMRRLADLRVKLPMKGLAESLNLSVSVGASLAHLSACDALEPDMDDASKNKLLLKWYMLSVKAAHPLLRRNGVVLEDADLLRKKSTVLGFSTT